MSSKSQIYPGPQRSAGHLSGVLVTLNCFTYLSLACLIFAILQENITNKDSRFYFSFLEYKILDIKTAATIFTTFIGLKLVRQHFLLGFAPRIIYESVKVTSKDATGAEKAHWVVRIRNVGLGAAVIKDYGFVFHLKGEATKEEELGYKALIAKMTTSFKGKDFEVANITYGYTLPAKEQIVAFEIDNSELNKIEKLDIVISFSGFLGANYFKTIYCIPR